MRILIVEDEQKMAKLLKKGLEEETHSVMLAHDGVEGWYDAAHKAYLHVWTARSLFLTSGMRIITRSSRRFPAYQAPVVHSSYRNSIGYTFRRLRTQASLQQYRCSRCSLDCASWRESNDRYGKSK